MREQHRKGKGEATDRGERGPQVGVPLYADAVTEAAPGEHSGEVCAGRGERPSRPGKPDIPAASRLRPRRQGAAEDGGREGGMRPKNSLLCWMLTNKGDRKAHTSRDLGSSACLSAPEDNSKAAPLARHTGPRSRGPLSSPGPQPPSGHREPPSNENALGSSPPPRRLCHTRGRRPPPRPEPSRTESLRVLSPGGPRLFPQFTAEGVQAPRGDSAGTGASAAAPVPWASRRWGGPGTGPARGSREAGSRALSAGPEPGGPGGRAHLLGA